MTGERLEAFKQVKATLEKLGPSKLQPNEHDLIADAAEGLLLSSDTNSDEAQQLRSEAKSLLDRLVEVGRWSEERAQKLREDIEGCAGRSEPATV